MPTDKIKVAFLDRDGVINKEVNYLYKIEDFEYTENCIEGLKKIKELGYEIIIVTNQAGIARGYYSEQQYQKLTDWYLNNLEKNGIEILDVFHCPHHELGSVEHLSFNCRCRKPEPGMLLDALHKYDIDIANSILIGDKVSDAECGIKIGIPNNYLVRSGHEITIDVELNYSVYKNLYEVSKVLI